MTRTTDQARPGSSPRPLSALVLALTLLAPIGAAHAQGSVTARIGGVQARSATGRDLGSGRRLAVQGTVTDRRGEPITGRVEVRRGTTFVGSARIVSGRYTLYDLQRGSYRLTVRPREGQPVSRTVLVGTTPITIPFIVRPPAASTGGRTGIADRVAVSRGGRDLGTGRRLAIQGTVTDLRGVPASGVVEVRRGSTLLGSARIVSGRYTLYDLAPGSYLVRVRPRGRTTIERTVTVGTTPVTIPFVVR